MSDLHVTSARTEKLTAESFSALAELESLKLMSVSAVHLLLPLVIHAPALRTLIVACTPDEPDLGEEFESAHPSREALRRLLAAAPLLAVRLEVAATIEEWRRGLMYLAAVTAAEREVMDGQWRDLQRAIEGLDPQRVAVVANVDIDVDEFGGD